MRVLWLPAVLRAAGLTVHEVPGWRTRGADSFGPVRGITCHHTAGSPTSSDEGEIRTLLDGSESAPPPIAQLYLSRTGDWWVVASGLCFHNRVGWAGPNKGYGNDAILGIEAQHSGDGEPWTARQYDSYTRGVAALVRHEASGWDVTVGRVAGHKEHQPGAKSDPSFDMNTFRSRVRAEISNWEDDMPLNADDLKKIGVLFDQRADQIEANLLAALPAKILTGTSFPWSADAPGGYARNLGDLTGDAWSLALKGVTRGGDPIPPTGVYGQILTAVREVRAELGASVSGLTPEMLDALADRLAAKLAERLSA